MKQVYNNYIPFEGFKSIAFWPFVFIRNGARFTNTDIRHEKIHGEQQKEMLMVSVLLTADLAVMGCGWWSLLALPLFFWWYLIEWLIKWTIYRNKTTAYKNIGFEREAYRYQGETGYLYRRKWFKWLDMIK